MLLASFSVKSLNGFSAQGLANVAWAFATMSQWDEKLCAALLAGFPLELIGNSVSNSPFKRGLRG